MQTHQKCYFIDCGAWEGISSKFFKDTHPSSCDFTQYAFECNPVLVKGLKESYPWLNVLNNAVWINDDKIPMYLGHGKYTESSSLVKEKRTGKLDKENPTYVPGIKFGKWLQDSFDKEDYLMVKMNIEGAEYEVLNQMLDDGSIEWIDSLYIQWHWKKINMPKEKHDALLKRIENETKIGMFHWNLDHSTKKSVQKFSEYFMSTI